jgi:tetratricopeptide (TPR) repeat protein
MRSKAKLPRAPLIAVCLAAAALACRSDGPKIDPEKQLALHRECALRYYDDGDLLRAEDQVDKGLELAPRDKQLKLMKGWIRQRRGTAEDIYLAEQVFRELAPGRDYRALLGLAEALERKGILYREASERAGVEARRAAELEAEADRSWKESVEYYGRTLEHKPGEPQALNGLQRVHALRGEYERALGWSEKLLAQSGSEIAFWEQQLGRENLGADEEHRLRALLLSSRDLQAATHLQASTLLVQMGREREALEHVEAALALDPDAPETHSRRAQLLHALGRPAEAVASLENYLRLSDHAYDHPDVARALDLLSAWKAEAGLGAEGSSAKRP